MSHHITALSGEYLNPKYFRFSRNQEEAGISHLPWEHRLKPLHPICNDVLCGLVLVLAFAIACSLA